MPLQVVGAVLLFLLILVMLVALAWRRQAKESKGAAAAAAQAAEQVGERQHSIVTAKPCVNQFVCRAGARVEGCQVCLFMHLILQPRSATL